METSKMSLPILHMCLLAFSTFLLITPVLSVEDYQDAADLQEYEDNQGRHHVDWPWDKNKDKKGNFKCPSSYGVFPDVRDCSQYFLCVAGVSSLKKCRRNQGFDKHRKVCLPIFIVTCDKGDDTRVTTKEPNPKSTTVSDGKKDKFKCPSLLGSFMDPEDCSKYYSCTFYIPTLKTCPESQLFDGVKKECKPAKDVHCGSRQRPDYLTTEEPTTTAQPTTSTTVEPTTTTSTTAEPTTTTSTTAEPTTTTSTTAEPTTTEEPTPSPTTTHKPRVTAPETDCDEDDVDCIIDDLGETPDWFICPEDVGSHPHPSSKKLFIFCLNWKPSVKKCGQDLIFSETLRTCVIPKHVLND